jgi:hypothetical protein
MSYAGPVSRARRAPNASATDAAGSSPAARGASPSPRGAIRPLIMQNSTRPTPAVFAAGIALGIVVGAGVALLFAPQSGADIRQALAKRSRRVSRRGRDAWDDLGYEFRRALNRHTARRRRKMAEAEG